MEYIYKRLFVKILQSSALAVFVIFMHAAAFASCSIDANLVVYPAPQSACLNDAVQLPAKIAYSSSTGDFTPRALAKFTEAFGARGIKLVKTNKSSILVFSKNKTAHEGAYRDEGYRIDISAKPLKITIAARSETGFFYAAETLKALISHAEGRSVLTGFIDDYPAFKIRGVLEGGYNVWSHESRVNILKWMHEVKFNTFLYGPKEDPYFRRQWRRPYPPEILDNFKTYLEICKRDNIIFSYSLSPALSIEYSNPDEFAKLVAKYRQLQSIGVTRFGIFFDDVLPYLSTPRDKKMFSHIAEAEVYISNKLLVELRKKDPNATLFFVPNQYWGWTPTTYMKIIKEKLDPQIEVGWTGKEIVSEGITADDALKFREVTGRQPAIGDNFSPLGPLVKRTPDLVTAASSFINNPYSFTGDGNSELSKFVNSTIADYGWNPAAYEPARSFDMASRLIARGVGSGDALALALRLGGNAKSPGVMATRISSLIDDLEKSTVATGPAAAGSLKAEIDMDAAAVRALEKSNIDPLMLKQLTDKINAAASKLSAASDLLNSNTSPSAAAGVRKALGM